MIVTNISSWLLSQHMELPLQGTEITSLSQLQFQGREELLWGRMVQTECVTHLLRKNTESDYYVNSPATTHSGPKKLEANMLEI